MEYLNIEYLKKGLGYLKKPFFGENLEIDIENNKKMEYYRKSSGFKDANDAFKEKLCRI